MPNRIFNVECSIDSTQWVITENGQRNWAATWPTFAAAKTVLTRIWAEADKIAGSGYHQAQGSVYVFVHRQGTAQRVDVTLPDRFTGAIRRDAIRAAVIRHLLDQESR
jgi:hypothetical protein